MAKGYRPRMEAELATCSYCGKQFTTRRPRSRRIAQLINPGDWHFCKKEHARLHWLERQRVARVEAALKQQWKCQGPGCGVWLTYDSWEFEGKVYIAPGRPRRFCSDPCKAARRKARERKAPGAAVTRARTAVANAEFAMDVAKAGAVDDDGQPMTAAELRAEASGLQRDHAARVEQALRRQRRPSEEQLQESRSALEQVVHDVLDKAARLEVAESKLAEATATLARAEARAKRRAEAARRRRAEGKLAPATIRYEPWPRREGFDPERARTDPEYAQWARDKWGGRPGDPI